MYDCVRNVRENCKLNFHPVHCKCVLVIQFQKRVRKFIRQIRINPLMDESSSFVDPTFAAHVWITTPIPFCDVQVKISTWKNSQDDSKSVVILKNWLRLWLSPVLAIMWAWGKKFGYWKQGIWIWGQNATKPCGKFICSGSVRGAGGGNLVKY